MILPNGQLALIREKYLTDEGFVVVVYEKWRDQAAHDAGEACGCSHDLLIQAQSVKEGGYEPHPLPRPDDTEETKPTLERHIAGAIMSSAIDGTISVNRGHRRGTDDKFALLAHPHIVALEVTP